MITTTPSAHENSTCEEKPSPVQTGGSAGVTMVDSFLTRANVLMVEKKRKRQELKTNREARHNLFKTQFIGEIENLWRQVAVGRKEEILEVTRPVLLRHAVYILQRIDPGYVIDCNGTFVKLSDITSWTTDLGWWEKENYIVLREDYILGMRPVLIKLRKAGEAMTHYFVGVQSKEKFDENMAVIAKFGKMETRLLRIWCAWIVACFLILAATILAIVYLVRMGRVFDACLGIPIMFMICGLVLDMIYTQIRCTGASITMIQTAMASAWSYKLSSDPTTPHPSTTPQPASKKTN